MRRRPTQPPTKADLRRRLASEKPSIPTKADFTERWNDRHNIWAPLHTRRFVCATCLGRSCQAHPPACSTCSTSGFVPLASVNAAYAVEKARYRRALKRWRKRTARLDAILMKIDEQDLGLLARLCPQPDGRPLL